MDAESVIMRIAALVERFAEYSREDPLDSRLAIDGIVGVVYESEEIRGRAERVAHSVNNEQLSDVDPHGTFDGELKGVELLVLLLEPAQDLLEDSGVIDFLHDTHTYRAGVNVTNEMQRLLDPILLECGVEL